MSGEVQGHESMIEVRRGGRTEALHRLSIAVADGSGELVAYAGEPRLRTFWRSAAKPFQMLSFVACGGPESYGLGAAELALMASSHNGEAGHRAAAARILAAAGVTESDLLCGVHLPADEPAWRDLALSGGPATPLWNNCSGKHAGMLAYCRMRGWPTFDYRRPDHPLQVEVREVVTRAAGEEPGSVEEAIDGCGVPVFHLSLGGMATAYARLAARSGLPEGWRDAAAAILAAAAAEPWFLAGTGRLCTRIAELAGSRVIAKVGAAGIFCAVLRDRGWGLAVKVEDGSGQASAAALVEALRQLEVLDEREALTLAPFGPGVLRNHAGTAVGELLARFRLRFA